MLSLMICINSCNYYEIVRPESIIVVQGVLAGYAIMTILMNIVYLILVLGLVYGSFFAIATGSFEAWYQLGKINTQKLKHDRFMRPWMWAYLPVAVLIGVWFVVIGAGIAIG
ncbi:MAG: hypothetical protein AAFR81_26860 [Chloroflexota bacterium]